MGEAPRHIPHQIVPQLLCLKLHNKHTVLCRGLFVLPPHKTEGYFCFLFTMLALWELTVRWKTLLEDCCGCLLASFLSATPLYLCFHFLSSSATHFTSCLLLPSLHSAPLPSFVSLSPDSRQGLIHVQCLHLFPPGNLCCQGFSSVWMARLSYVCTVVSWGVDMFLRVQHETDCSR